MKNTCLIAFALFLALSSCRGVHNGAYSVLDKAIEMKPAFDARHERKQDSLRLRLLEASDWRRKWETSYELEKIFLYHDVDSCYSYIQDMLRLHGGDPERKAISEACYANILYKMDSLTLALRVLEGIDTRNLSREGLRTYSYAGYHIYDRLCSGKPECRRRCREIIDNWWEWDSSGIECTYYHNQELRREGLLFNGIERLAACNLTSPNDSAKANYFYANEYLHGGNTDKAIEHYAKAAVYDLRVSAKASAALYELAKILFRRGDIRRADRYMRMTLEDASSSNYAIKYNDIVLSEFEIMNALLRQQQKQKWTYFIMSISVALMLLIAIVSLILLIKYSSRLSLSRKKLNEESSIKDGFLANYMEKCVDYLNKVDEYRSSLRHTLKLEGEDAARAMLRKPSFAAGEFDGLLSSLDSTFLGIFPDFVEKVNEHMQEEYALSLPSRGTLSTELRILALIKMGISKRGRIAKILNMSVATVYSYHSNLQKHSLHPDGSFDKIIASL